MEIVNKTLADIIKGSPMYKSGFKQWVERVMPSLKLPTDAPIFDEITKKHKAKMWAFKDKKKLIIIAEVDLDV